MPKTLNERLAISQQLMASGQALVAVAGADADVVFVKTPFYNQANVVTDAVDVWKSFPADTVLASFGL
jgi:hypothetical protein